jgi:hypothetical protein
MVNTVRKLSILLAILPLIAGGSICVAQHTLAQPRIDDRPRGDSAQGPARGVGSFHRTFDDFVFRRRVAGTFFGDLVVEGEESSFFNFVLTLHADGTVESGDSGDNVFGYESPSFGTWKRTGTRQVTIRQIYMRYDPSGNLLLFGRDTLVADFDARLQSATGIATGEALAPADLLELLDPNGDEVIHSAKSNLRMTRIEVDVPWGSTDGNDVPEEATPIDCPSFTTSATAIESFDDVDFYILEGTAGESVQIDIDTVPSESRLDTILGVFASDQSIIAGSDDDAAPGEPLALDSYATTTFPVDGVLYIAVAPFVFPYDFNGPGYSFGSYTMNVSCGSPALASPYVGAAMKRPEPKDDLPANKPQARFSGRYTPRPPTPPDSLRQVRARAGTYLAKEGGYFGGLLEIITLHMDGTFSVQFEGSQNSAAESVRGDCRWGERHELLCEGMDRLLSWTGAPELFDRISWVFDFDPDLDEPHGNQLGQELFSAPVMLNPPRPNLDVLADGFLAFGFGNEIPEMRRIEVAAGGSDQTNRVWNKLRFGRRVAGTYFGVISEDGQPPGEYFLARVGADGTIAISDTSDFLFGEIDGVARGAWTRTGLRRLEARTLGFLGDGDFVRDTREAEFSVDRLQATGSLTREYFLRSQIFDPLDPNTDASPDETLLLQFTMKRLVVPEEPAGE